MAHNVTVCSIACYSTHKYTLQYIALHVMVYSISLVSPSSGFLQQYGHCFTSKDNGTQSTRSCWTTLSQSLAPLPPTHSTIHTHMQMMPHPQGITHSDMVLLYQCTCV